MMETVLAAGCWVALILVLWFKTNVVMEYLQLAGLFKNYVGVSFLDYLEARFGDCFACRLVACNLCVGFWLSAVAGVWLYFCDINPLVWTPAVYAVGQALYRLIGKE